jgi:hypothetical protein
MATKWDKITKDTHAYPLDSRSWVTKIKDPLGNQAQQ